jgi:hypothetical protein
MEVLRWLIPASFLQAQFPPLPAAVTKMIGNVSSQNLLQHIQTLERAGGTYSRLDYTPGNDSAVQYVQRTFKSLGMSSVEIDTFFVPSADSTHLQKPLSNVIASIRGSTLPKEALLIGAHIDSYLYPMPQDWLNALSPGADDNASGVAAVMEVARLFADTSNHYANDRTIFFVAFNAEEASAAYGGWTYGSAHVARKLKLLGYNVRGAIILDMIGHNSASQTSDIVANPQSEWIGNVCLTLNSSYAIGLKMNSPPFPSPTYSDHSSFWNEGIPAILLVENYRPHDTSTYYLPNTTYHTSWDTSAAVNIAMVRATTQLALAAISVIPNVASAVKDAAKTGVPAIWSMSQNYPNPFNPTTKIEYSVPHPAFLTISIFDLLGRKVSILASGMHGQGTYSVVFDATNLPSGIYFCQMHTEEFSETRRLLFLK